MSWLFLTRLSRRLGLKRKNTHISVPHDTERSEEIVTCLRDLEPFQAVAVHRRAGPIAVSHVHDNRALGVRPLSKKRNMVQIPRFIVEGRGLTTTWR